MSFDIVTHKNKLTQTDRTGYKFTFNIFSDSRPIKMQEYLLKEICYNMHFFYLEQTLN